MKFHVGNFYENLSKNSKFGENEAKVWGTLRQYVIKFHHCRQQKGTFDSDSDV